MAQILSDYRPAKVVMKKKYCMYEDGFEFEIHTDKSSGTGMLPPSRHRKTPDPEYKWVRPTIPVSDEKYGIVLEVLTA